MLNPMEKKFVSIIIQAVRLYNLLVINYLDGEENGVGEHPRSSGPRIVDSLGGYAIVRQTHNTTEQGIKNITLKYSIDSLR